MGAMSSISTLSLTNYKLDQALTSWARGSLSLTNYKLNSFTDKPKIPPLSLTNYKHKN